MLRLRFLTLRIEAVNRVFAQMHPNAKAAAAIGQPLLGDGVLCASRRKFWKEISPPAHATNKAAVMRAGNQDSTSSARAANLPAHVQSRPDRSPL